MRIIVIGALMLSALTAPPAAAQRNAAVGAPFILETSYWLQPGQTGHFIALLNKNKIPLLWKTGVTRDRA